MVCALVPEIMFIWIKATLHEMQICHLDFFDFEQVVVGWKNILSTLLNAVGLSWSSIGLLFPFVF